MKRLILRIKKTIEKKPVMYTLLALSASIMMLALALILHGLSNNAKPKEDVISVEDGYLVVNGVKTEYRVELTCNHDWQTATTPPTCTEEILCHL